MRKTLGLVLGIAATMIAPLVIACRPAPERGDALGSFAVSGPLVENACAPGLAPIDPLSFRVSLRRSGGTGYWRYESGPPAMGTFSSGGRFRFVAQSLIPVIERDEEAGVIGCAIIQTETIEGTLGTPSDGGVEPVPDDAGAASSSAFVAEQRIEIGAAAGGDCSALLLSAGGGFPALPCVARYALRGTRTD